MKPKRVKDLKAKTAEEFRYEPMPSAAIALRYLVLILLSKI